MFFLALVFGIVCVFKSYEAFDAREAGVGIEDDEYIVKFYSCGVYQKEADYFTGDWGDALGTAEIQVGLRKVVVVA